MKWNKIGIIGGAGPLAISLLYRKIIQKCQQDFGAKQDNEFPEIILISYPFSNMVATSDAQRYQEVLKAELQYCFDTLQKCKVKTVVIACNTLYSFLDGINTYDLELLNIVEETLDAAGKKQLKNLLILATEQTIASQLYKRDGVNCIAPDHNQQQRVSRIIDNICAGKIQAEDTAELERIVHEVMKATKVDGVVLGCTELPILTDQFPLKLDTVLDSVDAIVQKLINPR